MASGTIKELANGVTSVEVSSAYSNAKVKLIRSGKVKQLVIDGLKDLVNRSNNFIISNENFPVEFKPSLNDVAINATISGPECYRILISKSAGIIVYPYDGVTGQANFAQTFTYI